MSSDGEAIKSFPSDQIDDKKFDRLCTGVTSSYALLMKSCDEVLQLKDELLKHNLPTSVQLSLALCLSTFYRRAVEHGVSANELVRLVRLYSAPWEQKSVALRKLHHDYESKQKKLNIALKKLEMIEGKSKRMESEKRVMNWEKLFSKLVGARTHGHRWRFMINRFKQKLKDGGDMAWFLASDSDSDSEQAVQKETDNESISAGTRTRSSRRREVRFMTEDSSSEVKDLLKETRREENKSLNDTNLCDSDSDAANAIPFIERPERQRRRLSSISSFSSFTGRADTTLSDASIQTIDGIHTVAVPMIDRDTWTHESIYDLFLHVRIFDPQCNGVAEPSCSIVFCNDLKRTNVFRKGDENMDHIYAKSERLLSGYTERLGKDTSRRTSKADTIDNDSVNLKFQDVVFKINETEKYAMENGIAAQTLSIKVAIHADKGKISLAMGTLHLNDIEIVKGEEGLKFVPNDVPLFAMVNAPDRELTFNQPCGKVGISLFTSQKFYPKCSENSTETLSLQELIDEALSVSRQDYRNRCKSAGVDTDRKPIYTEEEMEDRQVELQERLLALQEEYEQKINDVLQDLSQEAKSEIRSLVSCCTSPIFKDAAPLPQVTSQDSAYGRAPSSAGSYREDQRSPRLKKRSKKRSSQWGQGLPKDFLQRVEMFQEARQQHFHLLQERINDQTSQIYIEKLSPFGHVQTSQESTNTSRLENLCLPALFMPTKSRTFCTPKAKSYFHMVGNNPYRVGQPSPIVSLPQLKRFVFCPELVKTSSVQVPVKPRSDSSLSVAGDTEGGVS